MMRKALVCVWAATVSMTTFAEESAFQFLCTIEAVAHIGANPDDMEVFTVAASRTPMDLAVKDTYIVRPGGVREIESQLLLADWRCSQRGEEVYCVADTDLEGPTRGYFHINEKGLLRFHHPTKTYLRVGVGICGVN